MRTCQHSLGFLSSRAAPAVVGLVAVALSGRLAAESESSVEPVSFETLLQEITDRDGLARLPEPHTTCRQASSYDRDTVAPDKPGWFANWDRSQFVRVDDVRGRQEHVLMDAEGPGAIVRFWATWHGPGGGPFSDGTLRIYLDGAEEPVLEGPMSAVVGGALLAGPPLSASVAPETDPAQRGHNLYLPIPYAKRCRVTYETQVPIDRGAKKGEALYYQINYRTYAPGTPVRSFSRDELEALRPRLARVSLELLRSGVNRGVPLEWADFHGPLAAHGARSVVIEGPAAIRELTVNLQAEDGEQALRSTVLEISFDDEPAVWCPAGDFFGVGYRRKAYRTWYTEVTLDGSMSAYWVMPFARRCRLRLHNLSDRQVDIVLGRAGYGPWQWDERSLHFHATWREYPRIATGPNKDMTGNGAFDVNYVQVEGQGRYVGDTLVVFNGTDAWWGEGDEKIYVDGEAFPSHIGTGSEDYYGYAWCKPAYFAMPFHAQPEGGGNLQVGLSVNSRYRALDAIPFRGSLRVDMELWHWRQTRMNYAPATFWYARPGARSNVPPDSQAAARPVARREEDVIEVFRVPGALEGESLRVVETAGGTVEVQHATGFGWSGNEQLWWRDGKPGDRLVLEFPVAAPGRYRLRASVTKARDYGIVRLSVGGEAAGELDRYWPEVARDILDLGTFDFAGGQARLAVEIAGANEQAVKKHMFGLDYLLLERAE